MDPNAEPPDTADPLFAFDQALQAGQRPSIEALLEKVAIEDRDSTLFELLVLELIFLLSHGQRPERTEYARRFSGEVDLVDDAFTEAMAETGLPADRRYAIERPIGSGGFGTVYLATDNIPRRVALKVPKPEHRQDPNWRKQFVSEVRKASRLRHPGIVSIYELHESGEAGDSLIVAMEYLGKGSLADVDRSAVPLTQKVEWVAQIAEAVQYAHDRGLVHRDLKPANILLDDANRPRVTDFGLAHQGEQDPLLDRAAASGFSTAAIAISAGNTLAGGTAAYMSPQQWRGEAPHRQDDVWSLGVILYELLAGRPPFAESAGPLQSQIESDTPTPAVSSCAGVPVPRALSQICRRVLAKKREERYATAAALARDLRRWLTRRRRWVIQGLASAAAVMALLAVLFTWHHQVQKRELAAELSAIASATEDGRQAIVAGDVTRALPVLRKAYLNALAHGEAAPSLRFLLARGLDAIENRTLLFGSEHEPISYALMSPDGSRLAGILPGNVVAVWEIDSQREMLRTPPQSNLIAIAEWSADGKFLLILSGPVASVIDVERGVTSYECKGHTMDLRDAAFSPDLRQVATASVDNTARIWSEEGRKSILLNGHKRSVMSVDFDHMGTRAVTASLDRTIRLWDVQSGDLVREFTGARSDVYRAVFSPDDRTIASWSHAGDTRILLWDAQSGEIADSFDRGLTSLTLTPRFDRTGSRCLIGFESGEQSNVAIVDVSSNTRTELKGHSSIISSIDVTADGLRVVTGSFDKSVRFWDGQTGQELLRLELPDGVVSAWASITADGSRVLMSGGSGVWRVRSLAGSALLASLIGRTLAASPTRLIMQTEDQRVFEVGRSGYSAASSLSLSGAPVALCQATGRIVSVDSAVRALSVWDAGKQATILVGGIPDGVEELVLNPSGRQLIIIATGINGRSFTVRVADLDTREVGTAINAHSGIMAAGFRENVPLVALQIGDVSTRIEVRNAANNTLIHTLDSPSKMPALGNFSPDGTRLVVSDSAGGASVWRMSDGLLLCRVQGHADSFVNAAVFSPDGTLFATGGNDRTVRVWDVASGKCLSVFSAHTAPIVKLLWAIDGSTLVASCADYSTRIWNVRLEDRLADSLP